MTPLQADTVGSAGPMLWVLIGAVGVLLLIACVNVASLFLARDFTATFRPGLPPARVCEPPPSHDCR